MAKITDYSSAARFDSGDVLIKDGSGGTKKMAVADAAVEFAGLISPINHRNVYRGKSLGGALTASQKTAISNGTFDDLFTGDYWTINSIKYVIADMNYFKRIGDTDFNTNHLVIVPAANMYSAQMNAENTTAGAYVGSKMYTENLESAKSTITAAFGSAVKTHRLYLPNAATGGVESGGGWVDSIVDLMSEIMVYGSRIRNPGNFYTTEKHQLALFRLNPESINTRQTYWLRDVVAAASFAYVNNYGGANHGNASDSHGVRPFFCIG